MHVRMSVTVRYGRGYTAFSNCRTPGKQFVTFNWPNEVSLKIVSGNVDLFFLVCITRAVIAWALRIVNTKEPRTSINTSGANS